MRLNVGDLAVITGCRFFPELIGQICTITKPYELRRVRMPDGSVREHFRYVVRLLDGAEGAFSFRNLRPVGNETPVTAEVNAVSEGGGA